MANIKISDLTAAAAATGTQEFEVNDALTSKKVTGSQILDYVQANTTAADIDAVADDFSNITSVPANKGGTGLTAPGTAGNVLISTGSAWQSVANEYGFRNRIINGDMRIDQRNNGASVTITNTGAITYTLDRWAAYGNIASKFSVQQNAGSVTPPAGFNNYLGVTSLSAYSVLAADGFTLRQNIEGFNTADLGWGTANAKTVTVTFLVYSSLTGTFGGSLRNAAANRSYPFTYTVSAANTWEQKSVTVAGDTSGTWVGATNGTGITLLFGLGVGSTSSGTAGAWAGANYESATGAVSVVGTSGATFYITGVQLEAGSVATPFERRPYGTELALCQRYCTKYGGSQSLEHIGQGNAISTTTVLFDVTLPTTMRSTPSITTSGNWFVSDGITNNGVTSFGLASGGQESSSSVVAVVASVASGLTQFRPMFVYPNNSTSSSFVASAEL
jgi:hypothetical protein